LNELVPGDPITVTTLQGTFTYDVTSSQAVSPSDVAVVGATSTPQLTLTTCNPRYSASQRLVVHALLTTSVLAHTKAAPAGTPKHRSLRPVSSQPAHDWLAAILWGVAVAGLTVAVWVMASRTRRSARGATIGLGTLAWLAVLFYFFQTAAPLLPASF
jgi:sortase A